MKEFESELKYKDKTYRLPFNMNVMQAIQDEYGSLDEWGKLSDGKSGEPNIKAIIFGYTEMFNEGIDMDNFENGTNEPYLTAKQVGRIITDVGLNAAVKLLNDTVEESVKNEEKNV